jgi:hypothetical protein
MIQNFHTLALFFSRFNAFTHWYKLQVLPNYNKSYFFYSLVFIIFIIASLYNFLAENAKRICLCLEQRTT